ncbi:MAG: glycosyltransferase [Planctomycetota bacterium]
MALRILHISTRLILGGSQENTVLSCEGQARLGHEVHLAFGPIYGPEGSLLARVNTFRAPDGAAHPKIITHELPDLIRAIHPWRDLRALSQIRALIRKIRPDVVHTHSSKAGVLGRRAAWRERFPPAPDPDRVRRPTDDTMLGTHVPRSNDGGPLRVLPGEPWPGAHQRSIAVVHTIHGPPFMPVEGRVLARLKTRCKNALYTLAERRAAHHCHTIISVADAMTAQFRDRHIGRDEQYVTVRSGMELAPFLEPNSDETRDAVRSKLGLSGEDFVVGTVARLAQHKGHDDLLDALGDDLRRHPRWKLLWVGDGWWKQRLLERVRALGVERQVVTTGLVPPGRVPGLIRAMDVLAHPSYREGLPRTVPQALLCGVLPIAYDADGTREACIDMETGRLVPVGDRDALRDAIRWAHDEPLARAQLAEHGQRMALRTFGADHMVRELEKVYADALATARLKQA